MKYIFLFVFFTCSVNAQNVLQDYFSSSEMILLPQTFYPAHYIQLKFKNDTIVALNRKIIEIDSTLLIEIFRNNHIDTVKLARKLDSIKYNAILDFDFIGTDLLLLSSYEIQFYKKSRNYYEHYKTLEFPYLCTQIMVFDSTIICNAFYPTMGNRNDSTICKTIAINTITYEEKLYEYYNPKGLQFINLQPRKIMDANKSKILLSSITKYEIIVYNQGNPIDTLSRVSNFWKQGTSSERPDKDILGDRVPQRNYSGMMDNQDKKSLMSNVSFQGDYIVASWTYPDSIKSKIKYFDVWKMEDNKYFPYLVDMVEIDGFKDLEAKFNPNNFNNGLYYCFNDSCIATVVNLSLPITKQFDEKTNKEVKEINDDNVLENKLRYNLLVRKIKW